MEVSDIIKGIGKKVVFLPQKMFCNCTDSDILEGNINAERMMKSFLFWRGLFHNYSLQLYLYDFTNRVKYLIKDPQNADSIKKNWTLLFRKSKEDIKYFIAQIFMTTGIFDDEICKLLIEFAQTTINVDYRYYLAMDISNATFGLEKGYYEDYYVDRRELLKKIALDGNYTVPKRRKQNPNRKKVCIIAYLLDESIYNSMQRVAMMVSREMADRFDEVVVYDLDSFYVSPKEDSGLNTISKWKKNCGSAHEKAICALFDPRVRIKFMSITEYKERFQIFLNDLYEENPDVIIDMADEFSALSYFYAKDFPTLYMPLRIGASSQFFTAIEGVSWRTEMLNKKFHYLTDQLTIDWFLPEYVPPETEKYSRRELDLPEDAFVIVTIGKCANSANEEFIDELIQLLDRQKKMLWLIVGDHAPVYFHKSYSRFIDEKRVIERPFEEKLKALCENCDVLLRTDNTGGSGATAIGAMAGLPIAMTNFLCDPMRWLGRDYSTIDNYHDLMVNIERMYLDNDYYCFVKEQTISLVKKATDAKEKWDELAFELLKMSEKEE